MAPVRDSLLTHGWRVRMLHQADIPPGCGPVQTRGTPSLGLPCTAAEAAPGVHLGAGAGLEPGSGPPEASARVRVRKLPLAAPSLTPSPLPLRLDVQEWWQGSPLDIRLP